MFKSTLSISLVAGIMLAGSWHACAEPDAKKQLELNAKAWHKNYTSAPYLSGDQFFKKVRNVQLKISASPQALEKISSLALQKEIANLIQAWGLTQDPKSSTHLHIDVSLIKRRWNQTLSQGYRVTQRSSRDNYALSLEAMVTVPAVVYLDGGFHGMRVSPRGAYVYGAVKQPEIQSTAQFTGLLRKYMGELKKSMQNPKYSKPPAVHYWPESEAASHYRRYLTAANYIAPFGKGFLRKGRTVRDVSASYKASLRRGDARSKYPLIDENALRIAWRNELNQYGMRVTGKGPISQSHDVGLYFGAAANTSQLLFSGELDFFYAYYSRVDFSMQNCVYLFEGKFYRGKASLFDHSKILPLRSKELKTEVYGHTRKHREQILIHHTTPP